MQRKHRDEASLSPIILLPHCKLSSTQETHLEEFADAPMDLLSNVSVPSLKST